LKSSKKKFEKMFEKKFAKKVQKYYKSSEGRGGREGGELSFQCLRPSTSLMAAGKNIMTSDLKFEFITLKRGCYHISSINQRNNNTT
jgi:hypothetical protein